MIEMGQTRVVCAASVEEAVPRWMKEQKVPGGWITAEYSMLPFSTSPRKSREVNRGHPEGRTQEIQRLIGRSMRAVVVKVVFGLLGPLVGLLLILLGFALKVALIGGVAYVVLRVVSPATADKLLAGFRR